MSGFTSFGSTLVLIAGLAAAQGASAGPAPSVAPAAAAARCEALQSLALEDTTIVSAAYVAQEPTGNAFHGEQDRLPPFCRVVARVQSDPDSDIGVEIWLPAQGWTGVFHGNGNGGFAGLLASGYAGMAEGLRRGFAAATTDTGTAPATPLDGDALIGHPRKWRDWGHLSTHVMTVTGKAITREFYGRKETQSYYTGCSTGGQQGLIEALYYPADYDGILVGAPVINRIWGHAAVLWDYAAAHETPGSRLSDAKLKLLNRAAIATCWAQGHGLAGDPFISDPLSCKFDPAVLECTGALSDQCLTPAEVATARAFYSGPTTDDGEPVYHRWLPGSEAPGQYGWSFLQSSESGEPPFSSLFKWVFGADWDWQGFDFEGDMPKVTARLDEAVNDATRGSLKAFQARGGKLIIYHGLSDSLVAPGQSVAFYERQAEKLGGMEAARDTARLFLAPGMMHCGGGSGPDSFNSSLGIPPKPPVDNTDYDLFSALIDWASGGIAPKHVIATKFDPEDPSEITFQRPLCPHPQKAIYRGSGSPRSASNFFCSPLQPDQ